MLPRLHQVNIGSGLNSLRGLLYVVEVSCLATSMLPLQVLLGSLTSSDFSFVLLILLDALYQIITAFRWSQVRHGDVDLLLDDSTIHLLVHFDADSALIHIKDNTRATMVVLERHALVDRGINLDVHIVTSPEITKVGGGRATALGAEGLLEESAGVRSVTKGVRHLDCE